MLPLKRRFHDGQLVIITNFVVISSVGIRRVVCTSDIEHVKHTIMICNCSVNKVNIMNKPSPAGLSNYEKQLIKLHELLKRRKSLFSTATHNINNDNYCNTCLKVYNSAITYTCHNFHKYKRECHNLKPQPFRDTKKIHFHMWVISEL